MMASFSRGDSGRGQVVATVHGYERVAAGEYCDANWLSVEVGVSARAFSGRFAAEFLTEDFIRFGPAQRPAEAKHVFSNDAQAMSKAGL